MGSCGTNSNGHGTAVVPRPHAQGPAAMLGIGTANPTGVLMPQDVFPDTLFRLTNSDHLTHLKQKLTRICTTVFPIG